LVKAETQLADARKKETINSHNYEMLKQSMEDEVKFASKHLADSKKGLAVSSEIKATAESDLGMTSKALEADLATKATLHQDCMTKAEDFES